MGRAGQRHVLVLQHALGQRLYIDLQRRRQNYHHAKRGAPSEGRDLVVPTDLYEGVQRRLLQLSRPDDPGGRRHQRHLPGLCRGPGGSSSHQRPQPYHLPPLHRLRQDVDQGHVPARVKEYELCHSRQGPERLRAIDAQRSPDVPLARRRPDLGDAAALLLEFAILRFRQLLRPLPRPRRPHGPARLSDHLPRPAGRVEGRLPHRPPQLCRRL